MLIILLLASTVAKAQTWQTVGSVDFSGAGYAYNTCIAIDPGGVPYIVYEDATREDKATVMKYNGTSWVPVDTEGVTPGGAGAPAIAMGKYGTPYVVYSDGTNDDGATVITHEGSSWVTLGSPNFSGNLINFPSIAIDTAGTVYVAYIDAQYSSTVTVMKYSSGAWVPVGTPGFGSEYSAYSSIALDPSGTPYVAYRDGYNGPATVQKFNGTNWVPVGSTGFTPTGTYSTFIKIDKYGTPYMTYAFGSGSYYYGDSAGVMTFNGTNWVSLNPTKFSVTAGNPNINITIDTNAVPYVVYQDFFNAGAATVKKYTGSSWVTEGNAGFSAAGVQYPTIALTKGGTPYVAYMDQGNNYGATVMDLAVLPAITGTSSMCAGTTYDFSDANAGGTWSSSNTSVATIGLSTGVVAAIAAGTTTITYTLGGSSVTSLLTVNPAAFIDAETVPMCVGGTVTLSGTPTGGTWISNIPSSATVNSSGFVTAIATGDGSIQYTLSSGCTASVILEINPTPAITTSMTICTDYTWSLVVTEGAGGGTWSSSNTSSVTVYNGSVPYMAGVAPGTSTISYTTPGAGCVATLVVTENADPVISGTPIVCGTSATTLGLSAGVTGGTWSSSNTYVTVGSSSGIITGAANGTSIITYTTPDLACWATQVVTDNPVPVINPFSVICTNTTVELELIEGVTGGTWSSSNTASFVTYSSAIPPYVWGVAPGTSTISYITPGTGCMASMVVTDNADPVISGTFNLCGYSSTTLGLSAGVTGGTWSSSNSSVAVGSSSGIIYGAAPGTSTITYTGPGFGCIATQVVTDNEQPYAISGVSEICAGSTTSYSDYPSGGLWSSGSTSVATVGTDGTVYGISAGTAHIIYTMPGGCDTNKVITIEPSPSVITGPSAVCTGTTIFLTDATPGGSWSTSSPGITLSDTGSVYGGYITGAATVTYTMSSGCFVIKVVTVNSQPTGISGVSEICAGSTTSYSDYPSGGLWTSGTTSVATIGTNGTVYGVSAGTANISYTMPGGCYASTVISVEPSPAISGPSIICGALTASLTVTPSGGTWTSSNSSAFTVSGSGVVTGVSVGTANISYTIGDGCSSYLNITDNSTPVINTFTTLCTNYTATVSLLEGITGGTWSSGNTASVVVYNGSDPYMWAVAPGTSTLTYTTPGVGCVATLVVTINPDPVISGTSALCGTSSSTLDLTAGVTGGTWSSSNSSISVGSSSGTITGIAAGTSTITYTTPDQVCFVTQVVTDYQQPGGMSGSSEICVGSTTSYYAYPSGGIWSSGSTSVATVGTGGTVYGVSAGTASIIYTMPGGCDTSRVITVNPLPSAISGPSAVCVGSRIGLTDATPGGSWSTGSATIFLVESDTVLGYVAGTATVTYTMPSGCFVTKTIIVSQQPGEVSGSSEICAGSTTSYSDYPVGGLWSSGSTSIATVGTSGTVYGVSAGTANISYTMPGGCYASTVISVEPSPAIGGPSIICGALTASLTVTPSGGTWSSSNSSAFTVSGSGVVTGVSVGTANISYTIGDGCSSYLNITDNPTPVIITSPVLCPYYTSTLAVYEGITGGAWSSSNTSAVAIVYSGTNTEGIAPGTSTISYTTPGVGCVATQVVTVNANPVISGTPAVCGTSSTTLDISAGVTGGTWSSSSPSVTVGSNSGIITGIAPGTSTITYTAPDMVCTATQVVTDYQQPGGISGSSEICAGSTTSYSDYPSGGLWSSGSTSIATIGTNGTVYGVSAGTANISYTMPGGCYANSVVTVEPLPSAISSPSAVCVGSRIGLTDATPGGSWSTGSATIFLVESDTVLGYVAGTATVTYTMPSGCFVTKTIIVSQQPGGISGSSEICAGSTTSYSDYPSGGLWSSGSTSVATVGTNGMVYGVSAGTANISYTVPGGCYTSTVITIDPLPSAIGGPTSVCVGSTITLTDAVPGGSWSSGSATIISEGSGVVLGYVLGTARVTYTMPSGCYVTAIITVNTTSAGTITGTSSVTVGSFITLSDATGSGVWSASNTNATVTTGVVTGEAAGTVTISYGVTGSCGLVYATKVVTVNNSSIPGINGNTSLCAGSTTTLTDASAGGTWSISDDVAVVVGSTGVVTASTTLYGTATVTYTSGGASTTITITVNANPTYIEGATSACAGTTITLTDATAGGTWTGSGDATVSGTGTSGTLVAGSSAGTSSVTYTVLSTGCSTTRTNTIYANPLPISGSLIMCTGTTAQLTDATSGGVWTSGNTTVATVSGLYVTGHTAGTSIITYTIALGSCYATQTVTVNAQPANISGNVSPVCPGVSFTLTDGTGLWSSSNTAAATVETGGSVTGVAGGTATITYLASGITGCMATTIVTINTAPAITGGATVCTAGTIVLSDASAGGAWSSGSTGIATVGATGIVSGVSNGTAIITYTTAGSCIITTEISVIAGPSVIGGATNKVCVGNTITLTDATAGGTWSSSNASLGSVDNSGDVFGAGAGTVTITYAGGGCSVTALVTVNALPGVINGVKTVCSGSYTILTDATTGGSWSIAGGIATIGSAGAVTGGSSTGTATVSYTLSSTGCAVGAIVTVNATAGAITGNSPVCAGAQITLTDGGGTWSSSSSAVATIGSASGVLTGEAGGTARITYSAGGCITTVIATVNGSVGVINGAASVCQGATLSLSDVTTGGAWTSSNTLVATVGTGGSVTGVVTGSTSAATAAITYTTGAGCATSKAITVNPSPESISGNMSLCPGGTTTLSDGTTGGTWSISSDNASVVGSTGVVTASATLTGTATITYTVGGCTIKSVITVNPNPTGIGGSASECTGTTVTLTDATAGGSWSSTGDATASGTGTAGTLVAGATAGTASVTYTIAATGCYVKATNTIYASPAPIGGTFTACTGVTDDLTDATSGGAWSSSNTAVATAAGFYVTGHTQGTTTITYQLPTGSCYVTQVISVNLTPTVSAISGPSTIHESGPSTLSDATAGGTWNSSNSLIIELIAGTSTPTVTAQALASSGSVTISYAVTNGWCSTTVTKVVGAATAPHPGGGTTNTTTLYAGTAVSLGGEVSGMWSSSDNTIATVDGSGLVTGIAPGSVIITHETTDDDGSVTTSATNVVVAAAPASISLVPNPNKGAFVVKGTVGSVADEEVTLEVTDVLGQVIYKGKVTAFGGKLNETIMLGNNLANGMYLLNVQRGTENKTIHFVIAQ